MGQIKKWLDERPNGCLHVYQIKTLVYIFIKFYMQFELEAVTGIQSKNFQAIRTRLNVRKIIRLVSN